MGRQLVAVDLDVQSAEAVHENVDRRSERGRVVVEGPLTTGSCGEARHDSRVSWFHHEDGGITASLEHRLVTFEDFRFGKRVGCEFEPASMELPDAICWVTEAHLTSSRGVRL